MYITFSNNGDCGFFNVSSVVSDLPADGSLSAQLLSQWLKADERGWVSGILTSLSSSQVIEDNILIKVVGCFLVFANCCLVLSYVSGVQEPYPPVKCIVLFFLIYFFSIFFLCFFFFFFFLLLCILKKKSSLENIKQIISRDVDKLMHYFISEVLVFAGHVSSLNASLHFDVLHSDM